MDLVSRSSLESLLASVAGSAPDPRAGIFGPASITWRINRESAVFLGAGRAALLQIAHPWVAAALSQHSTVLRDPIARFHNTFRIVYTMIYGSVPQALAASRHLHTLHTRIQGEMHEPVGRWPRGAHYEANEIAALRWVYATLVESAILALELVLPLTESDRNQYFQESKTLAALVGIPSFALPPDWPAFREYCRETIESDIIGVDPAARAMGQAVLRGAGSWIRPPRWYRALTAEWLPPRLRSQFGFTSDEASAACARRWLPRLYPLLPPSLRFVGPYREAQARLHNRPAGVLIRGSNRFWIGQPTLPFAR